MEDVKIKLKTAAQYINIQPALDQIETAPSEVTNQQKEAST